MFNRITFEGPAMANRNTIKGHSRIFSVGIRNHFLAYIVMVLNCRLNNIIVFV